MYLTLILESSTAKLLTMFCISRERFIIMQDEAVMCIHSREALSLFLGKKEFVLSIYNHLHRDQQSYSLAFFTGTEHPRSITQITVKNKILNKDRLNLIFCSPIQKEMQGKSHLQFFELDRNETNSSYKHLKLGTMCLHPPNVLRRVIHTSGSAFSKGVEIAAGSRCLPNAFNSCCVNTSSF